MLKTHTEHTLQQKFTRFKYRKKMHYVLILSVILIQLLLLILLYNKFYNEPKLEKLQADLHLSEQVNYFKNITKDSYTNAQLNLQNYIITKDDAYLIKYNEALSKLNINLKNLAKSVDKSDLLSLYLKESKGDLLSVNKIELKIDSIGKIKIAAPLEWNDYLLKAKKFNYETIIDSISLEKKVSVDSVKKKGLLARVSDAITNKVDVQKETENVVLTLGNNTKSKENLEKQFQELFNAVNKYYQKEFANYKSYYTKQVNENSTIDHDFLQANKDLLQYSNVLLEKYNEALVAFTNDTRKNFDDQYKANQNINNIVAICLIFLLVLITFLLAYLTKVAFAYEKSLESAEKTIKNNLNFKNRIVGMISHEIRAPLNIISIYSKGIRKQVEDEDVRDSLKAIEFTTNSLNLLANQILDYSKNEHTNLALNSREFSLQNELKGIFTSLLSIVENNGNQLIVNNTVSHKIPLVYSDPVKIHQLFYNLVGNANKFTDHGKITIDVKTENLIGDVLTLYVAIKDTGSGISTHDLKHIFDEYTQGTVSDKVKNMGVGLGLNLCKELITLYNGEIDVTSIKDVETVVKFTLQLPYTNKKN